MTYYIIEFYILAFLQKEFTQAKVLKLDFVNHKSVI